MKWFSHPSAETSYRWLSLRWLTNKKKHSDISEGNSDIGKVRSNIGTVCSTIGKGYSMFAKIGYQRIHMLVNQGAF